MKKYITFLLLVCSLNTFSSSRFNFNFSNKNLNALVALACAGEENLATAATGGGIERERLSVSNWNITRYGGEITIEGYCNADLDISGSMYRTRNQLELEIIINEYEIKNNTGKHLVVGRLGNSEIHLTFSNQTDVENRVLFNKVILDNIAIANGLAGARGGFLEGIMNSLITVSTKNSNMSLCNNSSKKCRKLSWNTTNNTLNVRAFGAGWLMSFGAKAIGRNIYVNTGKLIELGSPYRIMDFMCPGNIPCASTVLLDSYKSSNVSSCSKYKESSSVEMTADLCKDIIRKVY